MNAYHLTVQLTTINYIMIAQTCTDAGKNAGFCVWSSTKSCYVPGGRCYCDCDCTDINIKDCCDDVPLSVNCSK